MIDSLNGLFAATVLFVGGHFLLSSAPVRDNLVQRLREPYFRLFYSAAALGSFVWMLMAYGGAPRDTMLWSPPPALALVPVIVMPFALILAVCGVTTPSPTGLGGGDQSTGTHPSAGIITITRHPFLWAAALWAGSHLTINGDTASFILMGGILVLSLGGMAAIDAKRAARLGSHWGPIALTTSVIPFAAALAGRTGNAGRFGVDWAGIGWLRPLGGLALYILIFGGHRQLFGVGLTPF